MVNQRDSFLCATGQVDINVEFTKRLGAGFFRGEGFILERLEGSGEVFVQGGIKTAIFGGEGLFFAKMTGPGRFIVEDASRPGTGP